MQSLIKTLVLTSGIAFVNGITTAPGPVVLSSTIIDTMTTTAGSISFASAATCAPPGQQFQTFCCSGELVFPVATGSPQGEYSPTGSNSGSPTSTVIDAALAARDEPAAIGRSHSVHILPATELASGVTCFGSVATVAPGGSGAGAGSVTLITSSVDTDASVTSGGMSMTSGGSGIGSVSSVTDGATMSESTTAMATSAESSAAGSAGPSSTAVTGAATRDAGSLLGGLAGLLLALL